MCCKKVIYFLDTQELDIIVKTQKINKKVFLIFICNIKIVFIGKTNIFNWNFNYFYQVFDKSNIFFIPNPSYMNFTF